MAEEKTVELKHGSTENNQTEAKRGKNGGKELLTHVGQTLKHSNSYLIIVPEETVERISYKQNWKKVNNHEFSQTDER